MDKISVIVPVYKVEKYITRCVTSILNQTYENLEIILVDDGSPDRCPEICDEFQKKDSRVKVIHKSNGGLSDARNVGIRNATGEWIGFVDSDDYICPEMYEILYQNAISSNADISVCSFCLANENDVARFNTENRNQVLSEPLFDLICRKKIAVNAWNKLYKRELFRDVEFPVGMLYEDLATTYKLVAKVNTVVMTDAELYAYVQRGDSIMGNTRFMMRSDKVKIVKEMWGFVKNIKMNPMDEYLKGVFDYIVADIFNMLGSNTWYSNNAYRNELIRFVQEDREILRIIQKERIYRKTVICFSLFSPKLCQLLFNVKKR